MARILAEKSNLLAFCSIRFLKPCETPAFVICHADRSSLSRIQGLQQHLEQFVAHIRGALSTAAARFAHMREVP